ncbi:MAG: hypothetical protein IBX40_06645 [Methanosarcinales archaeon]|nr:hypothetical protein [Methanosarcinales archaeon]
MIEDILQVPRGGVRVIDDAQLFFNSMRTGDDDYMKLRNLANIIEKSKICLIFKELGFFGADTKTGLYQTVCCRCRCSNDMDELDNLLHSC